MLVSVPVPHCLAYYGFVILPEVWKNYISFLVCVPQDCFGNSGSFVVTYIFWIVCSNSVKNALCALMGISLNMEIALGSMAIFTIVFFFN